MKKKINSVQNITALIGFPLIFIIIVLIVIFYYNQISGVFLEPENLKAWVSSWGIAAPLGFIALQMIQVIIFIIPGEIPQIAGGYLFG
ncbi:MAG: hypothetical protein JXJ04_14440, partial [Spirochaetales bacterium]|nr:hypothetical protein [Spirochaetales bacterium]